MAMADPSSSAFSAPPSRSTIYICYDGSWTGDMWHCAAMTVFCQSDVKDYILSYPVTVLGMQAKVLNNQLAPNQTMLRGSNTFNFFRSIGIPIVLAKVNPRTTWNPAPNWGGWQDVITPNYIKSVVNVYTSSPNANCRVTWANTAETPASPATTATANLDVLFPSAGTETPLTPQEEALFYDFSPTDAEIARVTREAILHLWLSTSIVMIYLHNTSLRSSRIQYLQQKLGAKDTGSQWVADAQTLVNRLNTVASQFPQPNRKVVLFNYRIGDVNKQHDSNLDLLTYVNSQADAKSLNVIPIIVGGSDTDVQPLKTQWAGKYLELYQTGRNYDKRYTAAFWALVANSCPNVFGLIGGRSGSMDIASFMGVNCCSWDEPIFGGFYGAKTIKAQGGQLLRLLNQRAIMSVVYVTADATSDSVVPFRKYKTLEQATLSAWFARDPKAVPILDTVGPKLSRATLGTAAYKEAYDIAISRMTNSVERIDAAGLNKWVLVA